MERPEVGIYKRKKNKQHAFDQESDQDKKNLLSTKKETKNDNGQEKNKKERKHALNQEKKLSFLLDRVLGRFLGLVIFFFSYFLVFFYKFSPLHNRYYIFYSITNYNTYI